MQRFFLWSHAWCGKLRFLNTKEKLYFQSISIYNPGLFPWELSIEACEKAFCPLEKRVTGNAEHTLQSQRTYLYPADGYLYFQLVKQVLRPLLKSRSSHLSQNKKVVVWTHCSNLGTGYILKCSLLKDNKCKLNTGKKMGCFFKYLKLQIENKFSQVTNKQNHLKAKVKLTALHCFQFTVLNFYFFHFQI